MVKTHIGIEGNEIVDQLASDAQDPQACTILYSAGYLAHHGEHWPVLATLSKDGKDQTVERTACDLKQALKVRIAARHAKGLTYQGLYLTLWNSDNQICTGSVTLIGRLLVCYLSTSWRTV